MDKVIESVASKIANHFGINKQNFEDKEKYTNIGIDAIQSLNRDGFI